MTQAAVWKSRWGDPPLLPSRQLSSRCVWALWWAIAAFASIIVHVWLRPFSPVARVALCLFPLIALPAAIVLAYGGLIETSLRGRHWGRALAWIALAIAYPCLILLITQIAAQMPQARSFFGGPAAQWLIYAILRYGVLMVALAHVPAFAADSVFAKHLVVFGAVGLVLGSLLICGLVQAREQSRRLMCSWRLVTDGV